MALQFSDYVALTAINRGILFGMRPSLLATQRAIETSDPVAISVYSGAQPSAADIVSNWSQYDSTNLNFLGHFNGVVWKQPLFATQKFISISTFPTPIIPINNGVATWCIIWETNPLLSAMSTGTIPNTKFIVAPCSDMVGNGVIRFIDAEFSVSASKSIGDGVIVASI